MTAQARHGDVHFNPSPQEAETEESQIQGQPELHIEILSQKPRTGDAAQWQRTSLARLIPSTTNKTTAKKPAQMTPAEVFPAELTCCNCSTQ